MRILLVGHFKFSMYYSIMHKLYHGFIRLGHVVSLFDDRNVARRSTWFGRRQIGIAPMNARFLQAVQEFSPDLIVLGHCEMIWNQTLSQVRRDVPGVTILYRNVDAFMGNQNVKDVLRRAEVVDWIFSTTAGEELTQFAGRRAQITHIPNPVDRAIEYGRAFEAEAYDYDLLYTIGGIARDRPDPRPALVEGIRGACPDLQTYFGGLGDPHLFGQKYYKTLARAKMGLNFSRHNHVFLYSSDRMAQYMGNGLATLIPRETGFDQIFTDDEVLFFEGENELHEKLRHYADPAQEDNIRALAKAGWAKAHKIFASEQVCQYMIDRAQGYEVCEESYAWPTHVY